MRIQAFVLSIFVKSSDNAISAEEQAFLFQPVKHYHNYHSMDCTSAMLTRMSKDGIFPIQNY